MIDLGVRLYHCSAVEIVIRKYDFYLARSLIYLWCMDWLRTAIGEAAAAASLAELGDVAFPALARALEACPAYMVQTAPTLAGSHAIAGEHRDAFADYLQRFVPEDPVFRVAASCVEPLSVLDEHVDPRAWHSSAVYRQFYRPREFEHLLMV